MKKNKEASGKAAIIMALLPYFFFLIFIGSLWFGIRVNGFIIAAVFLTSVVDIAYCFTECVRGIMKKKDKKLFIIALTVNSLTILILWLAVRITNKN